MNNGTELVIVERGPVGIQVGGGGMCVWLHFTAALCKVQMPAHKRGFDMS